MAAVPESGRLMTDDSELDVSERQPQARRSAGARALLACAVLLGVALALWPRSSHGDLATETDDAWVIKVEEDAGDACAAEWTDCSASRCCQNASLTCFAKNEGWAACMAGCAPGLHEGDEDKRPWSCERLWSPAAVQAGWGKSETFAWKLVSTLTNEGKMALLGGADGGDGYAGYVNAQSFLFKYQAALTMNDGPQGYNAYQDRLLGTTTQYPCLLAVAASFDTEVSRRYATAVAEEFVLKGSNVMLGPDVEVTRTMLTGRSYETISGEDPFLGATLVQPFVQAVQEKGIIATVKHWLDNNQEIYRLSMNAEVGDRANHEIYMPVFKAAFDAGAAAVMCAYNKVYGTFACENDKLLKKLLREDLGFKGYVVSDWGATHDGEKSIRAGLDIEMPTSEHIGTVADKLVDDPDLQQMVDQAAVHVISAMHYVGQFDGRFPVKGWLPAGQLERDGTSDAHRGVALQTILDSAVLLRNEDDVLPLETKGKTIAMIGKYCGMLKDPSYKQGGVWAGGGSGFVDTPKGTTPLGSMQDMVKDATITSSADGSAAQGADFAVICVAAHGEEGWDRSNNSLPEVQALIKDVKRQSEAKVVVVAAVPGAVDTTWVKDADAVLLLFMPGEQVGPAFVKLLKGEGTPGGRLPVSFPKADEERFTQRQYPGWCEGVEGGWCNDMTANFSEGTLVGYRWNDAKGVASAYPFGYGLTYTTFTYSDFEAKCAGDNSIVVSFNVTNVGKRAGSVVPQLYVGFDSLKPVVRQLRGFKKIQLDPHFRSAVTFGLSEEDWSYFDERVDAWKSAASKGEKVTISVGDSSGDLKYNKTLDCFSGQIKVQ